MENIFAKLFDSYEKYSEKSLQRRRFTHSDLEFLIIKHSAKGIFKVNIAGKSVENRNIYKLQIGSGDTNILLWSQMHGNESTATLAITDLLNFFESDDEFNELRNKILEHCTITFLPMLNPDGADMFTRRNALGIDINRDSQRMQAPESKTLKQMLDELKPEFAFNLHDQNLYYGVGDTNKSTTIAFLAPPCNKEREVCLQRKKAMQIISLLNDELQKYIKGRVARYDDTYNPIAFGDYIQKSGAATILIESGFYPNDLERSFARKLNYLILLRSFIAISDGEYENLDVDGYNNIPENKEDSFFDLLIKSAKIEYNGNEFVVDIGIRRECSEVDRFTDYSENYVITDIGDLSEYFGHEEVNAKGLTVKGLSFPIRMQDRAYFDLVKGKHTIYKIRNGKVIDFSIY